MVTVLADKLKLPISRKLGFQMALLGAPLESPIFYPNYRRNRGIGMPFPWKTSISNASNLETQRIFISALAKPVAALVRKDGRGSSFSSPCELDGVVPPNIVIFVKGLAQSTTEANLKVAFSQVGEVSRVKVIRDKETKQSLGFAYIWFTREEDAQAALEEMNGQFLEGRFIRISIAKPGSCKPHRKPGSYKF